ncbi:hypothetical protein PV350_23070, partial [Streptomyces sp. PA03-6a]|nr:hypothetical protein [Streptomyces sp. PA03-6a]
MSAGNRIRNHAPDSEASTRTDPACAAAIAATWPGPLSLNQFDPAHRKARCNIVGRAKLEKKKKKNKEKRT